MVAAFGLGAASSALEKAIAYAHQRIQFGSPLIEKQGYTHKLLLPYVARLAAARAYIEEVALRLDSGETDLEVEGSLAKLFTTEVGNACADAAIQALGGYGYTREYDVEKIKRDIKILTIYEGTSEIQQLIISTFRWRSSIQSKGGFYEAMAARMDEVAAARPDVKAAVFAGVLRLLNRLFLEAHRTKATRQQHVMFKLAALAAVAETGAALAEKIARGDDRPASHDDYLALCARVDAAYAAQEAWAAAAELLYGTGLWTGEEAQAVLASSGLDLPGSQAGLVADLDALRALMASPGFAALLRA
jgi:alkylation response protein AidB-like acyl-CoA dehydrogenase